MIGVRVRNRSGSVDANAIVKRIEQQALQRRKRVHRRCKAMNMESLIELYSPTPEEEKDIMQAVARRLLPVRLMELGAFPETLKSLSDVSAYIIYSSDNTLFFDVSYRDSKLDTYITLPMVKVVMAKGEEYGDYRMEVDPQFVSDKPKVPQSPNAVYDRERYAHLLMRKKTTPVTGHGSDYTKNRPGTRILSLFLR
jgi:hypothetical protein